MTKNNQNRSKPNINVTPLIDVLLVVLIIFMIAAPLKPHSFSAQVPAEPDQTLPLKVNDLTLVVTIHPDRTLQLNKLTDDLGTVDDSSKLSALLVSLFNERKRNHVYRDELISRFDLPEASRIQKTVYLKAPRAISYGDVAKVIDGLKGAGAAPVGLQLDGLQ